MTMTTETASVAYTGDGTTVAFAYPFEILQNADIEVSVRSTSGAESTKILTTHYSVSGAGNPGGGTVTFVTAPEDSERIVIRRNMGLTQPADFDKDTQFPSERVEEAFDRKSLQITQMQGQIDRAVKSRVLDESVDMTLPAKASRATKAMGFDATGKPKVSSSTLDDIDAFITAAKAGTSASSASEVLSTGSTTLRTLADRFAEVYHVKDFGAVGDGTTDDSDAVQAAIDAAAALSDTWGAVDFTGGTYRVYDITITNPVTIFSRDRALLKPVLNPDGQDVTASTYRMFTVQSDDVTFDGLRFEGTEFVSSSEPAFPYYMIHVDEKSSTTGYERFRVTNCQFEKGRNQVRGVRLWDAYIAGNKCSGTTAEAPNSTPSWPIAVVAGKRCVITENTCWRNDGDGIKVATDPGTLMDTLIISNNVCYENARDGIDLNMSAARRILVEGNQLYHNWASQLEVKRGNDSTLTDDAGTTINEDQTGVLYVLIDGNHFITENSVEHTGDGSTLAFSIPFRFFDASTVDVYVNSVLIDHSDWDSGTTYAQDDYVVYGNTVYKSLQNGNLNQQPDEEASWWEDTYTLSDVGDKDGGTLTFSANHGAPTNGHQVYIVRDINTVNFQRNSSTQDWKDGVFSNNIVAYTGATTNGNGGHGIDCTDGPSSFTIQGNRLLNVPNGIKFDDVSRALTKFEVKGNAFDGYSNMQFFGTSNLSDFEISGNTFHYTNRAIQLLEFDGGGWIFIKGNTFVEDGTPVGTANCLLWGDDGATAQNISVSDNEFYVQSGYTIRISEGTVDEADIYNNRFNIADSSKPCVFIDDMTGGDVTAVTNFRFHDNICYLDSGDPTINFETAPSGGNTEETTLAAMHLYNNVRGTDTSAPSLTAVKGEIVYNRTPAAGEPLHWASSATAWLPGPIAGEHTYGATSVTSDGSGNADIAHGQSGTPAFANVNIAGDVTVGAAVESIGATNIVVRLFNMSDGSDATTSGPHTVYWEARE